MEKGNTSMILIENSITFRSHFVHTQHTHSQLETFQTLFMIDCLID